MLVVIMHEHALSMFFIKYIRFSVFCVEFVLKMSKKHVFLLCQTQPENTFIKMAGPVKFLAKNPVLQHSKLETSFFDVFFDTPKTRIPRNCANRETQVFDGFWSIL